MEYHLNFYVWIHHHTEGMHVVARCHSKEAASHLAKYWVKQSGIMDVQVREVSNDSDKLIKTFSGDNWP